MVVRQLAEQEIASALELVRRVFDEFEAPGYGQEGTDEFHACLEDDAYLSGIVYYGAFDDDLLVGVLGIRGEACHICFLFVDGAYQRLGIGTLLLERALADFEGRTITLNSSPAARAFYEVRGFVATGREQRVRGIRFTPMAYRVDASE